LGKDKEDVTPPTDHRVRAVVYFWSMCVCRSGCCHLDSCQGGKVMRLCGSLRVHVKKNACVALAAVCLQRFCVCVRLFLCVCARCQNEEVHNFIV